MYFSLSHAPVRADETEMKTERRPSEGTRAGWEYSGSENLHCRTVVVYRNFIDRTIGESVLSIDRARFNDLTSDWSLALS